MRSTFITGSLLAGVAAILVLPSLSARSARRRSTPRASAPAAAASPSASSDAIVAAPASFPRELETAAAHARRGEWSECLVALATVRAADDRALALRETLAAEALARAGELPPAEAAARRAMEAAGDAEPELAARAAFVAAEAREALGDAAAAEPLFAAAAGSGMPALSRAAALRRGSLLAPADPAAAVEVLRPWAESPRAAPAELAAAARAAEAAGDPALSLLWLRRLRTEHPTSAEATATAAHPLLKDEAAAALREGRAEDLLDRAEALLEAGQERLAAPDIEAMLRSGVPAAHAARLELLAGRLERMRGQSAKALLHLARAAASKDDVGCRAAFHASRAAAALRRRGDATKWMTRAASGCPCEWRDRAALALAGDDLEAGRVDAARAQWARLSSTGATPETRRRAAWSLGWSAWTAGRKDEAVSAFAALQAAAPDSREAAGARYWQARRLRETGDAAAADAALASLAADFPRDWYGLLAADETGLALPPPPACSEDDAGVALADAARVLAPGPRAARALLDVEALGLVEDALLEADAAWAGADDDAITSARSAFRALALSRAGRSREALREFRRAVPDWRRRTDVSPALQCAAWPLHHEELILSSCRAQGLSPELVFGLVHQESVFDEGAVSHAGARGLMQIMPATGQTIAKWLGERVTTARLLEPALNVRYGTTYLKRLLDESGRVEVALAGYNAGPGRARRWWAASGDDVALFVESIPFDETRDYVKAISVNERLYRCRLAGSAVAAGE